MTSLLVTLTVTIIIFPTETVQLFDCFMCDNEAGTRKCDENRVDKNNATLDAKTCVGQSCSVTSYVRNTAAGCQLSVIYLNIASVFV